MRLLRLPHPDLPEAPSPGCLSRNSSALMLESIGPARSDPEVDCPLVIKHDVESPLCSEVVQLGFGSVSV